MHKRLKWFFASAAIVLLLLVALLYVKQPKEKSVLDKYEAQEKPVPSGESGVPSDGCKYKNLSATFRDAAGDAFDRIQSLESNVLKGEIFYQPASQEAGRAVLKAQRIASNPDEENLSSILNTYHFLIEVYRSDVLLGSTSKAAESASKEGQQQTRATIGACLNARREK